MTTAGAHLSLVQETPVLPSMESSWEGLRAAQETIRAALPRSTTSATNSVALMLRDNGSAVAEIMVPSKEAYDTVLTMMKMNLFAGLVFDNITSGMEHSTRGRHRITARIAQLEGGNV